MNSIVFVLSYILQGICLPLTVKKIHLLRNDLWINDQIQIKTDKGFLYSARIGIEGGRLSRHEFVYHAKNSFSLEFSKKRYLVFDGYFSLDINYFKKTPDMNGEFMKFLLTFTDDPIKDQFHFQKYPKKKFYVTYKRLVKDYDLASEIYLKCDGIDIRMKHIKERFKGLVNMKLLKLEEYVIILDKMISEARLGRIYGDVEFNLVYFETYTECLENLLRFVKDIKKFDLIEDNSLKSSLEESSINKTTTIKVSQFINCLQEKFNEKQAIDANMTSTIVHDFFNNLFHRNNDNPVENYHQKTSKFLFKQCCNYLKGEILSNKFCLPIGGKYDIDYYIKKFFELMMFESIKPKQKAFKKANFKEKKNIVLDMIDTLKCSVKNWK